MRDDIDKFCGNKLPGEGTVADKCFHWAVRDEPDQIICMDEVVLRKRTFKRNNLY